MLVSDLTDYCQPALLSYLKAQRRATVQQVLYAGSGSTGTAQAAARDAGGIRQTKVGSITVEVACNCKACTATLT